jgi:hypothetical protein
MSPRTLTAPPDDRSMWRRALARLHPDGGGSHDLFIWAGAVRDEVCDLSHCAGASPEPADHPSRRREASTHEEPARVPYPPEAEFIALTARALAMTCEIGGIHGSLLEMLADCEAPPLTTGAWEQRGASYKSLADIGHRVGMSKAERVQWYRIAEAVPLSQRHAGHILGKLQEAPA